MYFLAFQRVYRFWKAWPSPQPPCQWNWWAWKKRRHGVCLPPTLLGRRGGRTACLKLSLLLGPSSTQLLTSLTASKCQEECKVQTKKCRFPSMIGNEASVSVIPLYLHAWIYRHHREKILCPSQQRHSCSWEPCSSWVHLSSSLHHGRTSQTACRRN